LKTIHIAVAGVGDAGKIHIANVLRLPQARLVYVYNRRPEKYQAWAAAHGYPQDICVSWERILADPNVDAVVICTPAATHCDHITAAAEAGKHILCEKPFDYSPDRIRSALKIVEKAGVKLQIGFNRRFDRSHTAARRMVEEGKIGDVHMIRIASRDPALLPDSYFEAVGGADSGILSDTAIHDFDMARSFHPYPVTEVFAMSAKLINRDKPQISRADTCAVMLRFEDGAMALIDNSWQAAYGYDQRVEVFGSKGMLTVENELKTQVRLHTGEGITGDTPCPTFGARYADAFFEELRQFTDALQNDTAVPVTGRDGLMAALISAAARRSAAENRPVKIEEI
jgi:myo-inositol 2-dehydrogenase/D-chiro-inositol 1-dehydrogenase